MQRIQLQLDLDVPNREAAIAWVQELAAHMATKPDLLDPVFDSEMAPPLTVTKKGPRAPSIIDLLEAQGRGEETPTGPWVKIDDYGQERVVVPEEYDYRSTPEGREAELKRRNELGPGER